MKTMKKLFLVFILSFVSIVVFGQGTVIQSGPIASSPSAGNYNKQIYQWANAKFSLTLGIPNGNGFTNNNSTPVKGNIYFDNISNRMGVWTGSKFDTLGYYHDIPPSLTFGNGITKTGDNVALGGNYTGNVIVGDITASKGSVVFNNGTASLVHGNTGSGTFREVSAGTVGPYLSSWISGNQNRITINSSTGVISVLNPTALRGMGDEVDYGATKQPLDYSTVKMLRDSVQLLRDSISSISRVQIEDIRQFFSSSGAKIFALNYAVVNGITKTMAIRHGHLSGLDADMLDGQEGSYYASDTSVVHKNGSETINGLKTINNKLIVNTAPTNPNDVVRLSDMNGLMKVGNTDIMMDGVETIFVIPHGLGSIPSSISITFEDASNLNLVQSIRTRDATNITLTCSSPPVGGTTKIYWQVYK